MSPVPLSSQEEFLKRMAAELELNGRSLLAYVEAQGDDMPALREMIGRVLEKAAGSGYAE